MCLPIRPMMASSLWTWVCDANRTANRAAAMNTKIPMNHACLRIKNWLDENFGSGWPPCEDWYLVRRMESEILLEFVPKPIGKWIFLYRGSVGGDEGLGFLHTSVQAVQIREQERVIGTENAAIFL